MGPSRLQLLLMECGLFAQLVFALTPARAENPSAIRLTEIRSVWQHQRSTTSVTLGWTERRDAPLATSGNAGSPRQQKYDAPVASQHRCWIHEDQARFHWRLPGDLPSPLDVVSRKPQFGDFQSVRLAGFAIGSVPKPPMIEAQCRIDAEARTDAIVLGKGQPLIARIRKREGALDRHFGAPEQATVRAVLMAFRPEWLLPAELGNNKEGLTETPIRIGGHRGLKLGWHDRELDIEREIWFDVDRAFAMCRSVARQDSRCVEEVDVDYVEEFAGRWIPRGWTIVCSPPPDKLSRPLPGQRDLFQSLRATVVERSAAIPSADRLRLSFPTHSVVHDERDQSWWTVSSDGSHAPISREVAIRIMLEQEATPRGPEWQIVAAGLVAASGLAIILGVRVVRNRHRLEQAGGASAPAAERRVDGH